MSSSFLAQCHHGICSDIIDHPFSNVKLDPYLVPTGSFVVVQFSGDVRDVYANKLPEKLQRRVIVDGFCREHQYERLEVEEGCRFSATKTNFEKPLGGGEARG